jgi:hypothetical protein
MKSVKELARISGRSIFRVRNWAREHGMKRTSGRYFFDDVHEAAFLSRRTMGGAPRSARTIAKKTGWSPEKVRKWAGEHGVEMRGPAITSPWTRSSNLKGKRRFRLDGPRKNSRNEPDRSGPCGRPRKEKPSKMPGQRGRPSKII